MLHAALLLTVTALAPGAKLKNAEADVQAELAGNQVQGRRVQEAAQSQGELSKIDYV